MVLVSYEFDGLIDFDFFFFHMGLIGLISYWWLLSWFCFHYFDILFWWVCWVSRTWIVMFWEEHEEWCVEGKKTLRILVQSLRLIGSYCSSGSHRYTNARRKMWLYRRYPNTYLVAVWIAATFLLSHFLFFFSFFEKSVYVFQWVMCTIHKTLQISFFNKTFIKNGSHGTIHTLKNYFATMFSIF